MALDKVHKYISQIEQDEHDDTANVELKKSGEYGWDTDSLSWKRVSVDANGKVNVNATVNASIDTTGLATDTNQTNGAQKTQIVDAGGEAVTVTGGKLDVNATASLAGVALPISGATEAVGVAIVDGSGNQITSFGGGTQYTEGDTDATITGTAVLFEDAGNTLAVPSASNPLPVSDLSPSLTDGSRTIQLVDSSNTPLSTTSQVLNVNATVDTSLLATASKQDDIITAIGAIPGGGGVQYTEGDTDATITGTAALVEGAANALAVMTQPLTDTQLRASDVKITLDGEGVTGTVTANAGTNLNTSALALEATATSIKNAVEIIDNAISGSEMQVDIVSAPTLTVNSHAVTNAGTFAVQVDGSALTSLQLIDDSIYTDGSGTVTKGVAILGQDGTNPQAIKTDASGELQVDVLSMPTTTVTATDLDIRNLTNTDVVTAELSAVDNAVLDTIAAKDFATQTTLAAINTKLVTGTDIGDVTINNASGGSAVNIQDGGNVITVDGTVTANATLAAETTKVIGTVNIAASQTVGLATGSNAIGKLAANSGVDIGDVDITSLPALAAGTNTIGAVKSVPSDIDINGSNANHADKYYTNAGAVTDGIVWSPAAGKRWHITTLYINISTDATVTLEDDLAGGDVVRWKGEIAGKSGVIINYEKEHPFCSAEDAADLIITTTAGNVYVQAVGYEV